MRPTFIKIDLTAIRANVQLARGCAPQSRLLACVKADAYGHGLAQVSSAIEEEVEAFGVANLEEAWELRKAGISKPILLLEGLFNSEELEEVLNGDFWITLHSEYQVQMLKALSSDRTVQVWLKMDSGMHRLGFSVQEFASAYQRLSQMSSVQDLVLMTHFACSEELYNDFTPKQLERFETACQGFSAQRSCANSAAILAWPQSHMDWIRPGFMLYGASPFSLPHPKADVLRPAMSFCSQVIAIREITAGEAVGYNHAWRADRDSRIAVVAAGYGDGYPRNTANGTPVLVDGQRASTVGHVAMDMLLLDVTYLQDIQVGSDVELWGKNLSINEVSASSGYSPYELMTRLTGRVPRIYEND